MQVVYVYQNGRSVRNTLGQFTLTTQQFYLQATRDAKLAKIKNIEIKSKRLEKEDMYNIRQGSKKR